MGRVAGKNSRVYVDEFNYSGRSNSLELSVDVNLPEVTCFEDTAQEFVEGQYGARAVLNGFFDPTDDNYDEKMWDRLVDGAKNYIGMCFGALAAHGDILYEMQGEVANQARPIEVAGAVLLNVTWQGNGPVVRATVLCNGAVTATGAVTNSNKNLGATNSGEELVAVLRVLSVSGSGSITVEIEESSDDGSGDAYASIIAFAAKTAIGVERKSVATATEAWKRVNVTAFSGFTSVTLLVTVGKAQGVS